MAAASRVVVIGAGPGGIAAARRLRDRAGDRLEVLLVERGGVAEYLPGTIPTLIGETSAEHWRQRLSLRGVGIQAGEVEEVSGSGVKLNGRRIEADAVIAAPGLALATESVPDGPGVYAFWNPSGAAEATGAVRGLQSGVAAVVISSLPYRCPPAPYGVAMQLAEYYRREGRAVQVVLTTPEEVPLAAIGGDVPQFLKDSLAAAGIELILGFHPDLNGLGGRELRSAGGEPVDYDLALVIPPHVKAKILSDLPGQGPLVQVSPQFESPEPGLFVVGDAAMTQLPRAADAAAAEARTAADAVLERLGLAPEHGPHMPAPECFLAHGGGEFSRISMRYPNGLPPQARAEVTLDGPSESFAEDFETAFGQWRGLRLEE